MGHRWSLRTRFVLVTAACLLPLFGAVVYVLYQSAELSRDRLVEAQGTTAEVVARVLSATVEANRAMLAELASEPSVRSLEPQGAESALNAYRRANPNDLAGLFLVGQDGAVIATSGLARPLPSGIGDVQKGALGPTGIGVSNRLIAEGGAEVVAIAIPVVSQDQAEGQPSGVVGAVLSVEQLAAAMLPFERDEGTISVVGRDAPIVTRTGDGSSQQNPTDRLAALIAKAAGTIGTATYEDGDGTQRLAAFAPVGLPGVDWVAVVTRPAPAAFAPNRMLLAEGLGALLLAAAAAVVLAVAAGEWVARPVRGLTEQALALTRGDFAPRANAVRTGELGALGAAFRTMAARFATQLRDLEAAREENAARAEQLRELNRRTVRLQEDERRRIAAEIHDAVAPLITGALYQARALRLADGGAVRPASTASASPTGPDQVAEGLDAVGDLLARAMTELHDVIFDLRPPDLDDLGVVAAIERYVGQVRRSGLACRLEVEGDPPGLSPEVRLAIYRIVQEALHNALRHAAADEAVVRLEATEGTLRVSIRDNGAGFDPARAARPSSLGLLSMRERATAIGASFAVASRPGDGTTVVIERRLEADDPPPSPPLPIALVTAGDASPTHDTAGRAANGAHAPLTDGPPSVAANGARPVVANGAHDPTPHATGDPADGPSRPVASPIGQG